jgi:hypothetical protein
MKGYSQIGAFCILTACIPYGDQSYRFVMRWTIIRFRVWLHMADRPRGSWNLFGVLPARLRARTTSVAVQLETLSRSFGRSHEDGWVHLVRRFAERWSRSVRCLDLCTGYNLVKASTTLPLLLAFPSRARACTVMHGARNSKCSLETTGPRQIFTGPENFATKENKSIFSEWKVLEMKCRGCYFKICLFLWKFTFKRVIFYCFSNLIYIYIILMSAVEEILNIYLYLYYIQFYVF